MLSELIIFDATHKIFCCRLDEKATDSIYNGLKYFMQPGGDAADIHYPADCLDDIFTGIFIGRANKIFGCVIETIKQMQR